MAWIKVTEQDIKRGVKGSLTRCPIAKAAKRVFNTRSVAVGVRLVVRGMTTQLPKVAHRFMDNFDGFKQVTPFSFQVRTPKEA